MNAAPAAAGADVDVEFDAWRCTPSLEPGAHRRVRTEMALNGFKWDAQVGDVCTLAPFAIVLPARVWAGLAAYAENLAREFHAAEAELAGRADLWPALGLPRPVREALAGPDPWTPTAARAVRFDFHATTAGWKISEVNSDVPGGYTEASRFTRLMAQELDAEATPAGDPTAALCDALTRSMAYGRIALLGAPGYLEDQQVIAHLAAELRARGIEARLATPAQVRWRDGIAHVDGAGVERPVDALFRFYQGEWMTRLRGSAWRAFFRGGRTPVCNPGVAVLSESKRLPVVWDELDTPLPTWRRLLPATRPALVALGQPGRPWVLKAAYSNTGDAVFSRAWSPRRDYAAALTRAMLRPREWVAQESFLNLPLATPLGPAHVCVGVYVIEGRACGVYGRLSLREPIDYRAIDTAILVEN